MKQQRRRRGDRLRLVSDNTISLSSKAQRTSIKAGEKVLPRTGTMRQMVFEHIQSRGALGLTDYELEQIIGGLHQTVSSLRRSLVIDNFIKDSGQTRKKPNGNDCIVWIPCEEYMLNGVNYENQQLEL
jgi:hypothetical protein